MTDDLSTPLGLLQHTIVSCALKDRRYSRLKAPGAVIQALSEDQREVLQRLTSESMDDVRLEDVRIMVKDQEWQSRKIIEGAKKEFLESLK